MAFRFPFEVLLRARQGLERQRELGLQKANLRVAVLSQQIEDALREMKNIEARRRPQIEAGISAAELQFDMLCLSVLKARQHTLEGELVEAEADRRARNEDFVQARREREVVETLRLQQLKDYQQQETRLDQRRLDDLFLLRRSYLRRN